MVSFLYRLARFVNDVSKILSGSPRKVGTRAKNKVVGRVLARAGIWRRLWK